jgi:hypothetical protein
VWNLPSEKGSFKYRGGVSIWADWKDWDLLSENQFLCVGQLEFKTGSFPESSIHQFKWGAIIARWQY